MELGHGPRRVFLNIPFDTTYEPGFIGLVAGLVHLGKRPVTVLEFGSGVEPRLDRLLEQIRGTDVSVHDLSRVELSGRGHSAVPRFNMPFELGLAVAVARQRRGKSAHTWFQRIVHGGDVAARAELRTTPHSFNNPSPNTGLPANDV